MKVVAFDGSKNRRGVVAARLARLVEELCSQGAEAELVRLERVRGTGCYMCGRCGQRTGDIACSSPPEDGLRRCVRKVKAADAVVIGTPAYSTHASPATQELLNRLDHDRLERGDARLAGKPAAVVIDPQSAGALVVAAGVVERLRASGMVIVDDEDPAALARSLVTALAPHEV